ncbi:Cytochrome c-type biogenesis protein CcmH precursor [Caballeronia sordidicola]|uniref:Cytochrome c-type biogenesis protein CcmH n=1 Tax=Caballeronia sordidicola TaxID=196367 RepID=A0A158GAH9_CABSO|nr:c-type cytochrome biogenesis protein CcmI [Caballeronia sordidicola]SAL28841.1 Cytochrome c-type biogenesis protein CcmH precursor [Caballeronia sordidicola]
MITFWIVAAAMLIVAVLCAVVPLMQREPAVDARESRALNVSLYRRELAGADQDRLAGVLSDDQHAALRSEIEQRVLADTRPLAAQSLVPPPGPRTATRAATSALLIALFPAVACALYLKLGQPAALDLDETVSASSGESHDMNASSVEMMVSRLAFRLRSRVPDPHDAADWATLARSYAVLERPSDAAAAYARAVALEPGDAQLRADFADTLASANEGRLDGRASEEIAAALALEASNPKALALAASAAFEARRFAQAIGYWRRLIDTLDAASPIAIQARKNIDEALALSAITVTLQFADGVQAMPGATVILSARAQGAASTLLAERHLSANDLPATIMLDDSFAINPADTLSAYPKISVQARVVAATGEGGLSAQTNVAGSENRRATLVITASSG